MATKQINPKGISNAGQNGPPPKVAVRGSAPNARTVSNVPGGIGSRTGTRASEGATKKPSKGRRNVKGNEQTLSKGKLNISPKGGKALNLRGFKSTRPLSRKSPQSLR